jgi:hypothetical protein
MDTCGLERVERFRINLNEKNLASQKNTVTSNLPQRCRAVSTYDRGNDTLVTVSHARAAAKSASIRMALAGADASLFELYPAEGTTKLTVYLEAQLASYLDLL